MENVANLLEIARRIAAVASKVADDALGRELMDLFCGRLLRELGLPNGPWEPPETRH